MERWFASWAVSGEYIQQDASKQRECIAHISFSNQYAIQHHPNQEHTSHTEEIRMNPNNHDFCAGLANCMLVPERFELGEGITISQTYAHFMAPFLMAFAPAAPGKPHPAPWKPAKGGLAIDITAELFVPT